MFDVASQRREACAIQAVPPGWGYLSGEASPVGSVNSDDGHQFQRPSSNAMEGTRSVRKRANVGERWRMIEG
jgi:hypothetical protein